MGKILGQIFQLVENKAGIAGRIKLAQKTGIPRQHALTMRDKADLIKRFKKAATEILGKDIEEFLK
ncbi:MAG: hypothetical protein WCL37_00135 [Chrysiogenales bacterium]